MTQQELMDILNYCPTTGQFTWKVRTSNRVAVGDVAGHVAPGGYIQIRIAGTLHYGHRLAFLYMTGTWPTNILDHDNRKRADNRWANLVVSTRLQNMRNCARSKNNASGVNGVLWDRKRSKWMAHITLNYKKKFLGYFDDIPAAAAARETANAANGFHINHGTPK